MKDGGWGSYNLKVMAIGTGKGEELGLKNHGGDLK